MINIIITYDDSPVTTILTNDCKCGPTNENKVCPGNQCCSYDGICGGNQTIKDTTYCMKPSSIFTNKYNGNVTAVSPYFAQWDGIGL